MKVFGRFAAFIIIITLYQAVGVRAQQSPESIGGVGIFFQQEKATGRWIVVKLMQGGPAESSGLKVGDHVSAVDGRTTAGMSADAITAAVRGKPGTIVKLTVERPGFKTSVVALLRSKISSMNTPAPPQNSPQQHPQPQAQAPPANVAGTYANLSFNVDGYGGANRGMSWLYLLSNGTYIWGREQGTYSCRGGMLYLSGSYSAWGPGRIDADMKIWYEFNKSGKKYTVTMYRRGSLQDYPPPAR